MGQKKAHSVSERDTAPTELNFLLTAKSSCRGPYSVVRRLPCPSIFSWVGMLFRLGAVLDLRSSLAPVSDTRAVTRYATEFRERHSPGPFHTCTRGTPAPASLASLPTCCLPTCGQAAAATTITTRRDDVRGCFALQNVECRMQNAECRKHCLLSKPTAFVRLECNHHALAEHQVTETELPGDTLPYHDRY